MKSPGLVVDDLPEVNVEFGVMEDVLSNMEKFKDYTIPDHQYTPCRNHPGNRINYICKDEKLGICSLCLYPHFK